MLLIACTNQESQTENPAEIESSSKSTFEYASFIGKDYLIDDQHSYIGFKIKYFGNSPVRGRFDRFDGTVFYDESDIGSLSVSIFIDVNSINTGNKRRDNDLKSEGTWFHLAAHPSITFQSKQVIPTTEGSFDLVGNLSIKGIEKEITVPFQKPTSLTKDWAGNDQVDFSGKLTINRQDFEVFGGDFWSSMMENGVTQLSDEVEIEMDIHTRRPDYQARYDEADSSDINKTVLDQIKENGLEVGLELMDSLFAEEKLSAGKFSSIAYTLNAWKMHKEALAIFKKRGELFPEKTSTWNQLGITNLYLADFEQAKNSFLTALAKDTINSRAVEYLRLMDAMNAHKESKTD